LNVDQPNNQSLIVEANHFMSKNQTKKQQQILEQPVNKDALAEFKKKYRHDEFCRNKLRELTKAQKFLEYILEPEAKELLDLDGLEIEQESYIDEQLKNIRLAI
jgi:hypothetical protein